MSKIRKNIEYYRLPSEIDADMEGDNTTTVYANTNFGDMAATNKVIKNVDDGIAVNDAVNVSQLQSVATSIPVTPDLTPYTLIDGTRPFTGPQSMGGNKLTSVLAGTIASDGINKGQLDTVEGLIPTIPPAPDLSVYTLVDGLRPFTGPQSMGSNKLTSVLAGTVATDAVNFGQFSGSNNIQTFPDGNFIAWGDYTDARDGNPGYVATINPATLVASIGTTLTTLGKTIAIVSAQVTHEGESAATTNYDSIDDFLQFKTDFTSGDSTFKVVVFRTAVGTGGSGFRWTVFGYLV